MMMLMMTFMMMMYILNTPISSILILILITISISLMILNILNSSWLTLIIFLMMVGGMLVLFIYMVSISPNKKSFNISKYTMMKLMILCLMMNFIFSQNYLFQSVNMPILIFSMINNFPLMTFSISYLFLFLLILTLIFKKKSGPLRSSYANFKMDNNKILNFTLIDFSLFMLI